MFSADTAEFCGITNPSGLAPSWVFLRRLDSGVVVPKAFPAKRIEESGAVTRPFPSRSLLSLSRRGGDTAVQQQVIKSWRPSCCCISFQANLDQHLCSYCTFKQKNKMSLSCQHTILKLFASLYANRPALIPTTAHPSNEHDLWGACQRLLSPV
uniref:SWIM-type domain-containing protein n=1 Tax=Knipowitschia caucasica TaxID=637954 RepID=A0AAV2JSF3_KNICA